MVNKNTTLKQCPVCGSNDIDVMYITDDIEISTKENNLKVNSHVSVCIQCGFYFLNPRKSEEWYNQFYKNQNRIIGKLDNPEYELKRKAEYDFIVKNNIDVGKVFDIGAFNGGLLHQFKANGWDVCGNEPSTSSCQYAKEKYDIDLIDSISIPEETYDLITCSNVLEHIYDINSFIKNIVDNHMYVNGYLYIEVPDLEYASSWNNISEFFIFQHLNYFNPNTLKCLLQRYGLQIVDEEKAGTWIRVLAKLYSSSNILDYLTNRENLVSKLENIKGDIIIFGAGQHTSQILKYLNCNVKFIVDSNKDMEYKSLNNIPIYHIDRLNSDIPVLVSSYDFQESMVNKLKELGIPDDKIITLYNNDDFYFKKYTSSKTE